MRRLVPFFCLIAVTPPVCGQPAGEPLSPAQAQALVTRTMATELGCAQDPGHPMRYLLRKQSRRLTSTREVVETRDGDVARLLSINDRPLSPYDEQREQARLDALADNPSLQKHRKQSEDQDMNIVLKLLRMLPNAFLYRYGGTGHGPAGMVQRFTFRPNPRFNPPDFESLALTAMTGELWIDAAQERVVRLEGHLQQDTDYGWGILGKLNKGGWIVLEQSHVGRGQWRIVRVQMDMSLRVLFKTRVLNTHEEMSQYALVPAGLDYRQAIQILRNGTTAEPTGSASGNRR